MFIQLILMVTGAILGALFSAFLPLAAAILKIRRKKKFLGVWKSRYQNEFLPRGNWIDEDVEVVAKQGSLVFRNVKNPVGSKYIAYGRLESHDSEIEGQWHEAEEGAHACGSFHLFVHPMGNILYGLCSGITDTGERLYTGWVLARKEEDLAKAHQLLRGADLLLASSSRESGDV